MLIFLFIAIITTSIVYATNLNNKNNYESIEDSKESQVIIPNSAMEIEIASTDIKIPEISEYSKRMIEILKPNDSNIKDAKMIYNKELDREFTRVTYENYEIDVDNMGNIIAYKNFDDYSIVDKNKKDYIENEILEDKVFKIKEVKDLKNIVSMIETENDLEEYKLVDCSNSTESAWVLTLCRDYVDDLINSYDCVNLVVDAKDGSIWLFGKNETQPNKIKPDITKEEAVSFAEPIISKFKDVNKIDVKLSFFKPNYYWNNEAKKNENSVRLAWEIDINGSATIYIDAETGENIGGDSVQSTDCARVLSVAGFIGSQDRVDKAYEAFNRLGYDQSKYIPVNWSISQTDIDWVLSRPDLYGLYLACHGKNYGSYNILTDDSNWTISSTTKYGNWHFVYLDACSSSANTNWADSFGCNGYSGRCFVGWNINVLQRVAYEFDMEFFPRLGTQTVYDAVVTSLWIRRNAGDNSRKQNL